VWNAAGAIRAREQARELLASIYGWFTIFEVRGAPVPASTFVRLADVAMMAFLR
jgi:hypothetical protein